MSPMLFVPAFTLVEAWMRSCAAEDAAVLQSTYDDVLDVFKALLEGIPVDEDWYAAEYPAVADAIARRAIESASAHFQRHGHFEGRQPFADGWRDLVRPVPFIETQAKLRVVPAKGRLQVRVERDVFIGLIKNVIKAVPVDEEWYRAAYPAVSNMIGNGLVPSAAHHYVEMGYFESKMPFDFVVDEGWYFSQYEHVRNGIARGAARSAKDHFFRIGYGDGCRPVPR